MKVFHESGGNHLVMVTPGAQNGDVSDWMDEHGTPIRFDIRFVNGVAEVGWKMGEYLIENCLANRTPLIRVRNRIVEALRA